ncbi:hypothetical protein M885DRAFT_510859 [Pelagophyceae sp. CCMP2097]|nr:hypothetical protein M885DRAFT_510859 [Pelagophyceae sp. CCMP2097]
MTVSVPRRPGVPTSLDAARWAPRPCAAAVYRAHVRRQTTHSCFGASAAWRTVRRISSSALHWRVGGVGASDCRDGPRPHLRTMADLCRSRRSASSTAKPCGAPPPPSPPSAASSAAASFGDLKRPQSTHTRAYDHDEALSRRPPLTASATCHVSGIRGAAAGVCSASRSGGSACSNSARCAPRSSATRRP